MEPTTKFSGNRNIKRRTNDDYDDSNPPNDGMTASYTEIAFNSNYSEYKAESDGGALSKPSDPFGAAHGFVRKTTADSDDEDDEDPAEADEEDDDDFSGEGFKNRGAARKSRPASLNCDKSFPYNLEGTVRKDGAMTHFVAENLEFQLKIASPVTKRDTIQPSISSRNNSTSTPSTSGLIGRQFLLPAQQFPQIDSNVLNDIEIEAQYLAASVDNLTENLCSLLHSISSITADNVEIHKNAVNKLTDSMDANIKCMYTIMAKTEEISKSMKPSEQLAQKIRDIKRLVDMLESNL